MSQIPDSACIPLGIVLLTGVEATMLHIHHRRTGRGIPLAALLPNLLAGNFLLIALAIALSGGALVWIALSLLAALASHLADLLQRWN